MTYGLTLLIAGMLVASDGAARTPPEREALLEHLIELCVSRDVGSPAKVAAGIDFIAEARTLGPQFREAVTGTDLYFAIVRLSNLRHDPHLRVRPAAGGLDCPRGQRLHVPLLLGVDTTTGDFFVADAGRELARWPDPPAYGDTLVAVDGVAIDAHCTALRPYVRGFTQERVLMELAEAIIDFDHDQPFDLGRTMTRLTLRHGDGRIYDLRLTFVDEAQIRWQGWSAFTGYPGFEKVIGSRNFSLYRPTDAERAVLIVRWNSFDRTVADTELLMRYATMHDLLDHDIVLDATDCGGGSNSWYLLQRLTSKPFRVTHGNLRICDVTERLIEDRETSDYCNAWCREWIEERVRPAIAAGRAWTDIVPFKLRALPAGSDGMLQPAETRFRGRTVVLFGPAVISAGDQFAVMVTDNQIGHTIGLSAAGHSNTWEWQETVCWPGTNDPVVRFEWALGQTLRPDGEVLEGNPAVPDERVPITRANHRTWSVDLAQRALQHLGHLPTVEE